MKPPINRDPEPPDGAAEPEGSPDEPISRRDGTAGPSLADLPIAGITRRRVAWAIAAFVAVWIVAVFARQVGEAGAAADRADRLRTENAELAGQVDALAHELDLVQRQAYIEQQARAYGLGSREERPFTLSPDVSPLAADAPGSAAVRLGARPQRTAPLEVWLDLLFGPSR